MFDEDELDPSKKRDSSLFDAGKDMSPVLKDNPKGIAHESSPSSQPSKSSQNYSPDKEKKKEDDDNFGARIGLFGLSTSNKHARTSSLGLDQSNNKEALEME